MKRLTSICCLTIMILAFFATSFSSTIVVDKMSTTTDNIDIVSVFTSTTELPCGTYKIAPCHCQQCAEGWFPQWIDGQLICVPCGYGGPCRRVCCVFSRQNVHHFHF